MRRGDDNAMVVLGAKVPTYLGLLIYSTCVM
jgi:hypothetical protein